jgi:L-fuculose-phosphate aldolase
MVYRRYPGVNFVIHTHQNLATVLSVAGFDAVRLSDADKAHLGGGLVLAAYALPGTKRLVRNVGAALASGGPAAGPPAAGPPAALLARHGALLCGGSRHEAFDRAVALEEFCARHTVAPAGTDGDTLHSFRGKDEPAIPDAALAALHREIYRRYPGVNCILQGSSPAVSEAVAALTGASTVLPVMLDDVAQMAGVDIKIAGPLTNDRDVRRAASLLKGRNCLALRGNAALRSNAILCCAGSESDCDALLALAQKNCLAFLQARRAGRVKALPLIDRLLMRLVYLKKYSKKI